MAFIARLLPILSALFTSAAYSCPVCHTHTGEQVRAGIFNPSFGYNLLATALPFPVFAGLVAWLYFGVPARRAKDTVLRGSSETSTARPAGTVSLAEQK
ncbi:MAG: hypothetical protein ACJ74Z_02385 [Bryobacteraceae bacterium]